MKPWLLKQRRTDLGLTQEELADRTGLDQGRISRLENGKANRVVIEEVLACAKALGCTVEALCGEEPLPAVAS